MRTPWFVVWLRRDPSGRSFGDPRSGRSQHRGVGELAEQDPAGQLAGRFVDLEVRGGGVRVAEVPLQRRVVVDRRAASEVVPRARNVGGGPDGVSGGEPQLVAK